MTVQPRHPRPDRSPGAAPVGQLRDLDPWQMLAVLTFRDWFAGHEGRERVETLFRDALGPRAEGAVCDWAEFASHLSRGARRPLKRHDLGCACLGGDEAAVAQILSLAALGAREDAMLILSLLIPGDRLLLAAHAAEQAGRAVLAASRALDRARAATLH